MASFETVIGLEVHVQLATRTKIFCGCGTVFGKEANSQVCPVCLGLPGVLPVLNRRAFEYAVKVAIAFDCEIQKLVKFDRKNYYYPDLPKNYQISQYDMPIAYKGKIWVETPEGEARYIGITRAHLEEDAGKLMHDPERPFSYVDLNRTGTPLLEIVSEPEIRSPEEAYEYLATLKQIVKYLEVSDCNMEEGSLRCDANISLRERGSEVLGTKVEIKNLNSFKAVREALFFEEERQAEILEEGGKILKETRLWDENKGVTLSMREKEAAQDYRYFPEPDLVPFEVSGETVEGVTALIPELPRAKKARFLKEYGLPVKDVEILVSERSLADFFESIVAVYNKPQEVSNWVRGEIMMHMREKGCDAKGLGLRPEKLADILRMSGEGVISGLAAKEVLGEHMISGKDPAAIVKEKGLEQLSDSSALDGMIDKVLAENQRSVKDFKNGKDNALSYLIGQVMKETKGKANPKIAGEMLRKKLQD